MSNSVYTFPGGVRFPESMHPARKRVSLPLPPTVELALTAPDGTVRTPTVCAGDRVVRGQCLALPADPDEIPLLSSVCGTVSAVREGVDGAAVVIETDGSTETDPSCEPHGKKLSETSPEEILEILRTSGFLLSDGSGRSLYAKVKEASRSVSKLFVDCTETEPYLSGSRYLVSECAGEIVGGAKILMRALGATKCDFAVDNGSASAVNRLLTEVGASEYLRVKIIDGKYPAGNVRVMFYALTHLGMRLEEKPEDCGYTVIGCAECAEVFRRFAYGTPAADRLLTVGGDCARRTRLVLAPVGTPYRCITEYCGTVGDRYRLISGGPVSGREVPREGFVTPDQKALLLLSRVHVPQELVASCISCGRCAEVCPAGIFPDTVLRHMNRGDARGALRAGMDYCIDCGVCTYVCPASIRISELIAAGRSLIDGAEKEEQANGAT